MESKDNSQNSDMVFCDMLRQLCKDACEDEARRGFHQDRALNIKRHDASLLALVHSEVSEALEAMRVGDPPGPDKHTPEFNCLEAELADVVLRTMVLAHLKGVRLGEAMLAKMEYNRSREPMHGGKRM